MVLIVGGCALSGVLREGVQISPHSPPLRGGRSGGENRADLFESKLYVSAGRATKEINPSLRSQIAPHSPSGRANNHIVAAYGSRWNQHRRLKAGRRWASGSLAGGPCLPPVCLTSARRRSCRSARSRDVRALSPRPSPTRPTARRETRRVGAPHRSCSGCERR